MSLPNAKLSCEACQHRKTKCDKQEPCGACQKAGFKCTTVQRQRLPRGKTGNARGQTSALKARITRLEGLVSQLQDTDTTATSATTPDIGPGALNATNNELQQCRPHTNGLQTSSTSLSLLPNGSSSRLIAPDFWTELLDTVSGLRDVLETNNEDDTGSMTSTCSEAAYNQNALLFGSAVRSNDATALKRPPKSNREALYGIYQTRVDAILKILHWPTALKSFSIPTTSTDGSPTLSPADQSLEFAVLFAAMCSLRDDEIKDRRSLLVRYRQATELSLSQAGLMSSLNIVVLQAFVLYLVSDTTLHHIHHSMRPAASDTACINGTNLSVQFLVMLTTIVQVALRSCQSTAETWTLIATAVRIANAQGLNAEPKASDTVLDIELRRRLLWCIAIIDLQTSFDRGTKPLLSADELSSMPLNIDDIDLSANTPFTSNIDPANTRFTDMTFSLMTYHAMTCQLKLTEVDSSLTKGKDLAQGRSAWAKKIYILTEFEDYMARLSQSCTDPPSLLKEFTVLCAQGISLSMQLLLRRPLQGKSQTRPPPEDRFDVMTGATEVLERSLFKQIGGRFSPWSWNQWTKWYALAVLLAELCHQPQGSKADRAWPITQEAFDVYSQQVADGATGLLWKPIEKLMRKAKAARESSMVTPPMPMQKSYMSQPSRFEDLSLRKGNPDSVLIGNVMPGWGPLYSNEWSDSSGSSPFNTSTSSNTQNQNAGFAGNPAPVEDQDANWWRDWELFVNDIYDPNTVSDFNNMAGCIS
ncbi:uncharacterized protein KY384_004757 [Bacidia gigantensis]|uniref:uncharacterized protein n=1 Tax=Bacidia gigantensis TaxID=2732470 RepID=UPI001D03A5C9|nr:uncharacterized protein KY384_004757 [Bacidia gigantensis]KAG8530256.1 hypothetical protein KY384_004757 [Bacidia gigantensis]